MTKSVWRTLLAATGLLLVTAKVLAAAVELSDEERRQLAFRQPVLEYSAGPVRTQIKPGLCLDCGDYFRPYGVAVADKYANIYQADFRAQLKQLVQESGVLRGTGPHLQWRATLEEFMPASSVSAYEESQHPLTAGAVLTIRTVVRYELVDGEKTLASWRVESKGSSGTLQKWDEACGRALARNLRKFFASLKQDLVPDLTPDERGLIAHIDSEKDGTRSLVGNVMLGLSRAGAATGKVVGNVAWGTVEVLAASAPAMEQASANVQQMQAQQTQALQAMAEQNRRLDAEQQSRLKDVERQQAEQKADAVRERNAANVARAEQEREAAAKADADRRDAEARQKAQHEAEAKQREEAEARRQAEAARKQEEERRMAEKAASEAAERKEKQDYLDALARGTRLMARTCPDGEGKYYIVGLRPKISPRKVACVDVHYAVRCEGSAVEQTGVGRNFSGIDTGCYMGDVFEISPKPACPVEQVRVRVAEIRGCDE